MDAAFGASAAPVRTSAAAASPPVSTDHTALRAGAGGAGGGAGAGVARGAAESSVKSASSATEEVTLAEAHAAIARIVAQDGLAKDRLDALKSWHAAHCPHCLVATGHTQLVFGEGDPNAALMFVGEAPGETEDQLGRPFVGRAGKKLDEMIVAMGLSRERVYIANVLKSRPPENRTPLPTEAERCGCTLSGQIAIIRPRCIVALGGPAAKLLLRTDIGITKLRGQWAALRPPEWLPGGEPTQVMPTFHPAYLLRNYTLETRRAVWSDLQQAGQRVSQSAG